MSNSDYSDHEEPTTHGSAAPIAEALGAVQPKGRTGSAEPPQLRGVDASTKHFKLTYYDPPPGLERYVLALFHNQWDAAQISDRHPGALGQLLLNLRGRGAIHFDDHTAYLDKKPVLFSGYDKAAPFEVEGPWHTLGASLSPLGWAALTRKPADAYRNRFFPAEELLGHAVNSISDSIVERYREGTLSGHDALVELADWIADRLHPLPQTHEVLIEQTLDWLSTSLNPDLQNLFDRFDYSRRQVERLVGRYFGNTPAAIARKMRAIRASNLLAQPDLTDEGQAEIAAAFHDQPHMIREIRRYCGYTPTRLGGKREPMFITMLRMRNLERLKQFRLVGESDSA